MATKPFRLFFAAVIFLTFTIQAFGDPQWGSGDKASHLGITLGAYQRGAQVDVMPGLSFRQGSYGLVGLAYSVEAGYRIRDGGVLRGDVELYFLMLGIYAGPQLQANVADAKSPHLGVGYGIVIGPTSPLVFRVGGVTFPSSNQGSELSFSLAYSLRLNN